MNTQLIADMHNRFLQEYAQMQDLTIKQTMAMVLGREANTDDIKDFAFIKNELFPGIEMLAYKGKLLGRLYFRWSERNNNIIAAYIFSPAKNFVEASLIDINAD